MLRYIFIACAAVLACVVLLVIVLTQASPDTIPVVVEPESNEERVDVVTKEIVCSPESKLAQMCTMEYAPVCGMVQVQCVTTPCNPVPETFSNGCSACAQGNVLSYTQGECVL